MKFYDLKEVCKILKMNIQSIRRYIKEGKLKASRVGTHYIVTDESLKEFLEANKIKPTKEGSSINK